jgi:hypothetical protein
VTDGSFFRFLNPEKKYIQKKKEVKENERTIKGNEENKLFKKQH